ncbi:MULTISPECIES: hypothetical protein [Pelistega]|nr:MULTISPECIES: hypothetical protein [Pelistega]
MLYQHGVSRVGFDTSATTHTLPTPARQSMGASDTLINVRQNSDVVNSL